ncbi:ChaC-like protein [Athelia psychrophila]|uniref:glutathione-specific gamma-glutamylcyclotransferase n=1 Tax=Athelia psychrophila TaxID=1759441 RepID=A0A167W0H4_9AGAM|nr:ChaC-like protein [Fibularhizoctonia sp. CBS 109695]
MAPDKRRYIIFGYGSLIYNPGADLYPITSTPGYLKGYVRRFAQRSEDHRGTPESPGRVVTLIRKQDWDELDGPRISDSQAHPAGVVPVVWGMAYTIDPERAEEVKAYLDYREKGGYNEETVDIYGIVNGEERVIIPAATAYIGKTHHQRELAEARDAAGFNEFFMGPEPLEVRAEIISRSTGPSGKNKDYLYRIAEAVRELAPESRDWYLDELEAEVRKRERGVYVENNGGESSSSSDGQSN